MATELNAPSDEMLMISVAMREWINERFAYAKERVWFWDLAPCPDDF